MCVCTCLCDVIRGRVPLKRELEVAGQRVCGKVGVIFGQHLFFYRPLELRIGLAAAVAVVVVLLLLLSVVGVFLHEGITDMQSLIR